ncbi:DUF3551 domain-containing protein [Bradyrhizobium vignae]|uniref:DUF3551 domain-containing protein n=1 Tax=Bradyrhizobium vignae TaxID=1549949 RepID=UPI00100BD76A|nr:DUF3551 domain-containing protein [Bradyrhizobium vignae]RXH02771.1 DUF3551 domain-containing protein [Bradyrhizobium vignae]
MTTAVLKAMTIPTAALAAAIAFAALLPAARAGEYCSRDTDYMTDCSFSSMEMCEASRSGRGGECFSEPALAGNGIATVDRNVYAYSPSSVHHERTGRRLISKTNN